MRPRSLNLSHFRVLDWGPRLFKQVEAGFTWYDFIKGCLNEPVEYESPIFNLYSVYNIYEIQFTGISY